MPTAPSKVKMMKVVWLNKLFVLIVCVGIVLGISFYLWTIRPTKEILLLSAVVSVNGDVIDGIPDSTLELWFKESVIRRQKLSKNDLIDGITIELSGDEIQKGRYSLVLLIPANEIVEGIEGFLQTEIAFYQLASARSHKFMLQLDYDVENGRISGLGTVESQMKSKWNETVFGESQKKINNGNIQLCID